MISCIPASCSGTGTYKQTQRCGIRPSRLPGFRLRTHIRQSSLSRPGRFMREALVPESTDLQSSADIRTQISDLSEVITRFQVRVSSLREENRLLRLRLAALEDRVARLEEQDREAHLRLQRRFQPSDCAIGCLTSRVIHLGSCFQYLVAAIQRAFPRPPGVWQSLAED